MQIICLNYRPELTGIGPYTAALAGGLARQGSHVAVLTTRPHYPAWRVSASGNEWSITDAHECVAVSRLRHYVPSRPSGLRRLVSELSFGLRLLFAPWGARDVTIAVSPALFATWIASMRRGRSPFVVWIQDIYTLGLAETGQGGALATKVTRWVEGRTLRSADRVVVIHERFRDYVVREFGVDASKVSVIRNWTHLRELAPVDRATARRRLGWPSIGVVALHAGNMGVKQGLENVVAAARLADAQGADVRFVLLGGGSERDRLRQLAADVERIDFIDALPDVEFRVALAAADVLLVNERPGVAEMAVPSKLTSYFDAGRPVVAAASADGITASEVDASGGGIRVEPADPAALLAAVLELARDAGRAAQMGELGQRYRDQLLGEQAAMNRWQWTLETVIPND